MKSVWILALVLTGLVAGGDAVMAYAPEQPQLVITQPPHDGFQIWINDTMPVEARITSAADWPGGVSFRWSTTGGCFMEPYGATATFLAPDYRAGPTQEILLIATAWHNSQEFSSARVSSGSSSVGLAPSRRPMVVYIVAPSATEPAPNEAQEKKEKDAYQSNWSGKLGEPPAAHAAEFIHEIYEGDYAQDRDSKAMHLQKALLLRPDDPANIVIEFRLAIMLGQHEDPAHHQTTRPEEAQAIDRHIIEHYDYRAYYRINNSGEGSEDPEYVVPRVAIWASSYDSAISHDRTNAQKYATIALDDFYWTFQKRKADWTNAPRPSTQPSPFDQWPDEAESRLKYWESQKAEAAAGNVLGPDAIPFAQAAVNVFIEAYAQGPADEARVLRQIVAKYPDTPFATEAKARLAKLAPESEAGVNSAEPTTAPSHDGTEPIAASASVGTLPVVADAQPMLFPLPLIGIGLVGAALLAFVILRKRRS